jgi:hypothetical protein
MRLVINVARIEENRNACRTLVAQSKGNRTLGRPKHNWVDDIKFYDTEEWQ